MGEEKWVGRCLCAVAEAEAQRGGEMDGGRIGILVWRLWVRCGGRRGYRGRCQRRGHGGCKMRWTKGVARVRRGSGSVLGMCCDFVGVCPSGAHGSWVGQG
jgi:hypothetical protein